MSARSSPDPYSRKPILTTVIPLTLTAVPA